MDLSRIAKWIAFAAVLFLAWKYALPSLQHVTTTPAAGASATDNSCLAAGERASEAWSSGIRPFTNPPYDLAAWATFTGSVNDKISAAESACSGPAESCVKVREAMRNLKGIVTELDGTIRNATAPSSDIVQRQETIDSELDSARELVRAGK